MKDFGEWIVMNIRTGAIADVLFPSEDAANQYAARLNQASQRKLFGELFVVLTAVEPSLKTDISAH